MNTKFLHSEFFQLLNSFTNQERNSPVKRNITFAAILALSVVATSSFAQTYKPDWATKLVLAGGGTDVTNTVTFTTLPGGSAPLIYTFPNSVTDGYILQTDGSGNLTWQPPSSIVGSISVGGDLSGTVGNATVAKINGALLGNTSAATGGNLLIADGTQWVSTAMSGDATIAANGGITVSKFNNGTTFGSMAGQNATGVTITGGTINGTTIGGTSAAAGTFTNLTATGTVTLPAGSISATSLGLTDGKILIGDGSSHAAEQSLSQDVTITNTGVASVNSVRNAAGSTIAGAINSNAANAINGDNITHNATLEHATSNQLGLNLANPNTWTGTQTLGGVKLSSNAPSQLTANQNNWGLSASNSYFFISSDAARNVTGIANGEDGRIIVLVNVGAFGITLKNASASSDADKRFLFPGGVDGDLILAPGGTVTLMYDGTNHGAGAINNWRLISAQ